MSAFVYRVTLTTRSPRTREPYFINFECDMPSVSDLIAALNTGRLVEGEALFTRKDAEARAFVVWKRKPFALGRNGVAHIEPPDVSLIEYVEADHGGH